MSTTIASVFVMLASQLLPMIGIEVGSEQLTQTISTLVTIIAGLIIWYRRVSAGDVTASGRRK